LIGTRAACPSRSASNPRRGRATACRTDRTATYWFASTAPGSLPPLRRKRTSDQASGWMTLPWLSSVVGLEVVRTTTYVRNRVPRVRPAYRAARLTFINDVYQGTRCYSFPHPRYAVLLVSTPGIPLVFARHAAGRTAELRLQTDTRIADGYKTAPITNPDAASASQSCYLPNRNSTPQARPKQTACLSTNWDLLRSRPLLRVHAESSKHGVAVASSGLCFSVTSWRGFLRARRR
jgi:hypothetical protein